MMPAAEASLVPREVIAHQLALPVLQEHRQSFAKTLPNSFPRVYADKELAHQGIRDKLVPDHNVRRAGALKQVFP